MFYEGILNQEVKYDFGENITYHGDFAIHLRSHFSKLIDNREISPGGNNFELYFEFDDIDNLAEDLSKEGVIFVHEAREQPWRQKVVRIFEPDNNIIEIGESLEYLSYRLSGEGLSVEEITGITQMSTEFTQNSINRFGG
jgi:hypothetical protein